MHLTIGPDVPDLIDRIPPLPVFAIDHRIDGERPVIDERVNRTPAAPIVGAHKWNGAIRIGRMTN